MQIELAIASNPACNNGMTAKTCSQHAEGLRHFGRPPKRLPVRQTREARPHITTENTNKSIFRQFCATRRPGASIVASAAAGTPAAGYAHARSTSTTLE